MTNPIITFNIIPKTLESNPYDCPHATHPYHSPIQRIINEQPSNIQTLKSLYIYILVLPCECKNITYD